MGRLVGGVAQCESVFTFLAGSPRTAVERHAANHAHGRTLGHTFHRAIYCVSAMRYMHEPAHYQATLGAVRTLLEIVVDLTLIVGAPRKYPMAKLEAWERSAMLKQAEKMVHRAKERAGQRRKAEKRGKKPPPAFQIIPEYQRFIDREGKEIRDLRVQYWPDKHDPSTGDHPNRWTDRDLACDADEAGKHGGKDLGDFYTEWHSQLCWAVHGSGAVGVGNLGTDLFPGYSAIALNHSARFGMRAARLVLGFLGAFDPIMEERFKAAEKGHVLAHTRAYDLHMTGRSRV